MFKTYKTLIACATSAATLCAAAMAFAQDAPQPGAPPAAAAKFHQRMEERQAKRAQALHDALNIRPNQEAAFQTFTAAMRPERAGGPRQREAMPATTPERLDRMAAKMAERQQNFQRRADATKRFYAQLTPDQKKTFDALPMLGGGHGRGGHGFGGGHPGGPGGPPPGGPR